MGVNLPATHVLVRDATFAGVGPLSVTDLLQMMGRAGRGDRAGHAIVVVRPSDKRPAEELARALRAEELPGIISPFERMQRGRRDTVSDTDTITVATQVAAQLSRRPEIGALAEELQSFFDQSFGGKALASRVTPALAWLTDPIRAVAFRDDKGKYHLTILGLKATRAVLPLNVASGIAQLIRDLLVIDPSDRLFAGWQPLDHLIVLHFLYDRIPRLRQFSAALCEQTDAWMESAPNTSLLFREWIIGQRGASRAIELIGSLGISPQDGGRDIEEWARKSAYLAVFCSVVLYERGQGKDSMSLERRWGIRDLEGVEERWRDDFLWLLSGLAQILDVRCFYYHLRQECSANSDRIRHVKQALHRLRGHTFDLQEHLKYCSPLGPVLRSLRRV